ncbi:hypothetical protein GH714_020295 [Hevea brasiliensis]|uniref:G domain-containing protein n=1 Tax=Hevea brasiliensis TaxID=3981 RepID=A0A6A6M2B6_HEVBR|nr:hypothetical protein GH714_020295 [Hevea brasiliensis]
MAGSTGGTGSSSPSPVPPAPKILLAKPGPVTTGPVVGKFGRDGAEDETVHIGLVCLQLGLSIPSLIPGNSTLIAFSLFHVIGVIGPPGVGKSTIMNELYGFDAGSPGMLPPFSIQSEDNRAMARHCSVGIEPRISAERLILLDTQLLMLKRKRYGDEHRENLFGEGEEYYTIPKDMLSILIKKTGPGINLGNPQSQSNSLGPPMSRKLKNYGILNLISMNKACNCTRV